MKSHEDYIDALSTISNAITSDLYLEDVLRLIVTVTANVMNAKICALWLLDEKSQKLKIKATQAMSSEYLKERTIKVGEGIVGLVAQAKEPVAIIDISKDY